MRYLLFSLLLFVLMPVYGQVNHDSLKSIWQNDKLPDSTRIQSINKLAWEGFLFTKPDSANYYAQLHYDFAEEKGLKKEMAVARNTQGTAFYMIGNYARAIDYFYQSLKIKEEIEDHKGIAATLNNIGMIYDDQGNYPKAIEHYSMAIQHFNMIPENKKKPTDQQVIVASYHNLGVLYLNANDFDRALEYFYQTLELTSESTFLRERAYTFSNMGRIYLEKNELDKSQEYFEKAFAIVKRIGDENGIIDGLNNFSILYNKKGLPGRARSFAEDALSMAQKNNATSQLKDAAYTLYQSHKRLGNYREALNMHELYYRANDSIRNEKNKEEVLRQEYEYAYAKQAAADSIAFATQQQIQDLKIAEQQIQLKSEKTQRFLLYSILALLILLSFVGYRSFRRKTIDHKIITKQKLEVEKQKLEVEKQRDKIAHQNSLLQKNGRKIIEFNNNLESLVSQRTRELENSLEQIRNYQFNLAHKVRAPFVTLVGLLNLIQDERFDSMDNKRVLQKLQDTSVKVTAVLKDISEELNKFDEEIEISKNNRNS